MAHEWPQGFTSEFFSPKEFDHPELMDPGWIMDLDTLRMRCGFPIDMRDDARSPEEHAELYSVEIAKGEPYPTESAHLWKPDFPVRAGDLKPSVPRAGDGCELNLDEREIKLTGEIVRMHAEGKWPSLGLGIETGHWHVDDTPRLGPLRPKFWVAISR